MTHLVTICVQRTTFQLVHCRHFENGGRVVCVSADSLRAHHRQQTTTQMTRGERERSFIGASSKKEKAIMPGSGEFISVFHLKKCMEKKLL